MHDFLGLGIGLGRFIVILIFGYFIIKLAVKNGIKQAYRDITGKETLDEIKEKEIINEFIEKDKEKRKNKK